MQLDYSPQSLAREFARQLSATCPSIKYSQSRAAGGGPVLTIPAKHPKVGDITVWFDGEEVTVGIGELYHVHFDCMKCGIGEERAKGPGGVKQAVDWVRLFLDDEIVLEIWKVDGHNTGGSAYHKEIFSREEVSSNAELYTWSGPWDGRVEGAD